jgi:hypothetical protein
MSDEMSKSRSERGSALLIALVIVIIAVGFGGAFLTQALIHSNEQKWTIEADEAFTMCDAGMERARQALGVYKGQKLWAWKDIATYCSTRPGDGTSIKKDATALFGSAAFVSYIQTIYPAGGGANVSADNTNPALLLPYNQAAWSSGDANKVLFANSIPFQRGALYINISLPPGTPAGADPDNLIVTVAATLPSGVQRQVEGVLAKPKSSLRINGLAAVVSNDNVGLTGSIVIDGRDHNYKGDALTGDPGAFGIISDQPMSDPTNGSVGGNGNAPPNPKGTAANSVKGSYDFSSLGGYPTGPDGAMTSDGTTPLPNGTLKQAATDAGMYFNNQSAYEAWLTMQGGKIPDGAIVYLEFAPGNGQFNLGSGNSKSSILIVHTEAMSGIVKEVHGDFTGLILADGFVRNNGNSHIVGMVQLFSPTASSAGNVFGNGNAEIDFSKAALADLPGPSGSDAPASLVSYRRVQ